MPYYYRFVENYPRIEDLAAASEDEVFKLWQGLGYYNRARNLHYTAKQIASDYKGAFPTTYEDVISLKGVGEYTAAAIMSFAYNAPYAAVDGNVYRVLSRVFGVDDFIDTSAGKKIFQTLADELLDKDSPGLFNQAMMDFGSLQCSPKSPNCVDCPFADQCVAYNNDSIDALPQKRGKVSVRNRYFNYLDIRVGNHLYLRKRIEKDIWQNLYEFPLVETSSEVSFEDLIRTDEYKAILSNVGATEVMSKEIFKHVLSHQVIYATFYQIHVDEPILSDEFLRIESDKLHEYGVSRLIHRYIEKIQE